MVKQRRFFVLISAVVCSIILFSSCKADKKLHYVVKTPADWIRKDGFTAEGWKKTELSAPKGDAVFYSGENIIVTCFQYKNLDEYVRIVQDEVRKTAAFYQEEKREKLKINGLDARSVQSQMSVRAYPGIIFSQKIYFIKDRGTVFMIVCTAGKDHIKNLQPIIDGLLASFKTEEDR